MTLSETIAAGEYCVTGDLKLTCHQAQFEYISTTAEALLKAILGSPDLGIYVLTWPMKTAPMRGFVLKLQLENLQQCHLSQRVAPHLLLQ